MTSAIDPPSHDGLPDSPLLRRLGAIAYWLLLLLGCVVFFIMNFYTTLKEDDFFHTTIGGGTEPIRNLMDVVRSWISYMQYDARTANLVDFLFNGVVGKAAFNVCNTLVFGLMAHLVSRLTTGRNSVLALSVLFVYIVSALPVPGETMLWVAGSCNYLWSFTASLLFVAWLLRQDGAHLGWPKAVGVLVLAFLAGGANEGTTFGFFGGLVLYYLFNRDRVNRTVIVAMTGYLLGVILLVSCPGAWDRAALEVSHQGGVAQLLMERLRLITDKSLQWVAPVLVLVIGLVSVVRYGFKKTFTSTPWPFIFLVLLAFVFVLNKNHDRLYFPVAMASLMIVVMALHHLLRRLPWARVAVAVACLALCAYKYPGNISQLKRYQAFFEQAQEEIVKSEGSQVVLKARQFDGYSRFIKLFNFDSWNIFIRERPLCLHYGKDNIQFVNDTVLARYRQGRLLEDSVEMPFRAPACEAVQAVYTVPSLDYVAVQMRQDTISYTYQFAQAFKADGTPLLPVSYFPLLYHGHEYFIFPMLDNEVAKLNFLPFTLEGGESIDLVRTTPNPDVEAVGAK